MDSPPVYLLATIADGNSHNLCLELFYKLSDSIHDSLKLDADNYIMMKPGKKYNMTYSEYFKGYIQYICTKIIQSDVDMTCYNLLPY